MKKQYKTIIFGLYCLFVLWFAVFSRNTPEHGGMKLELFWSYKALISGNPDGLKHVIQNLENIAFFVPYGLLFPSKRWSLLIVTAFLFSSLIEVAQLVLKLGLCELDDVICNCLGASIGLFIQRRITKQLSVERNAEDSF